ncbi:T9SS type A sorting domain-containing protein [Flavobacterium sp.]|uniref:T9SS type A sorting domain-containing protein n=1 Tax=Flavobacterium sp. TaxID=239 RepID=UPI00374D8C8F
MKTKLLLLLLLANFSIYSQTNLVPNGDFEDWSSSSQPDNWFRFFSGFVSQSTTAQNGSSSTKLRITGSTNFINSKTFAVQANKTYRVTMYHRVASGTLSSVELSLYHQPNTFKEKFTQISDATFSSSQWRKLELVYTSTVAENIEVDIWATGVTGSEILLDNVSVVDINEPVAQYTSIPDINFENKLIALGIDSGIADGKVLTVNIASQTNLDFSSSLITNLTGIEAFKELENLYIIKNQIATLDLSQNTKLLTLDVSENQLTTLDVSQNKELLSLIAKENSLTNLDISNNIKLNNLFVTGNQLTSLNTSQNTALLNLICDSNKLTNIDVRNNTLLVGLYCQNNFLNTLDVSVNTVLTDLFCLNNSLNSINLSNAIALQNIHCQNNNLTSLDVTKNIKLNGLYCYNNQITSLDVKKNVNLTGLYCHVNQITNLDVSNNLLLADFMCNDNKLKSINVLNNSQLELFDCGNNQLTSLDISNNSKLYELTCDNNELTYLNLKNGNNTNIDLKYTNFSNNPNLTCILVDDVDYSNATWSDKKDATTSYSTTCTLGINSSVFDKAVLYPNPTKGEVNINNITLEKATVYNSLGQLVKTFTLNSSNTNNTINLSGLPKGIYYVYLINQDAASAKKVIIE